MNQFSRDLVQGVKEVAAFAEGRTAGARAHSVELPDFRTRPASHSAMGISTRVDASAPLAQRRPPRPIGGG